MTVPAKGDINIVIIGSEITFFWLVNIRKDLLEYCSIALGLCERRHDDERRTNPCPSLAP